MILYHVIPPTLVIKMNQIMKCLFFIRPPAIFKSLRVRRPPPKKKRAGDCERALFSPCSHLSSVMVQNSHTCEGDMMKENNIRTSEANRKTS